MDGWMDGWMDGGKTSQSKALEDLRGEGSNQQYFNGSSSSLALSSAVSVNGTQVNSEKNNNEKRASINCLARGLPLRMASNKEC